MTKHDDGPLPIARKRLADAVGNLVDPKPEWHAGQFQWIGSVYDRLRGNLRGRAAGSGRRLMPGSRLPCRLNALSLLCEIDQAAGDWNSEEKTTADRLKQLAARDWRPQDCEKLDEYSRRIEQWVVSASEILGGAVRVYLPQPCPHCGTEWVYQRDRHSGETVRRRALLVTEQGAVCGKCKASWEPSQLTFLARLLGVAPAGL